MRMAFLAKYREAGLLIMRVSLGAFFVILTGPVLLAGAGLEAGGTFHIGFGKLLHRVKFATQFAFVAASRSPR
ncbi:hypothetical protein BH18VER1_BH18VER1_04440 [soil metagenome]